MAYRFLNGKRVPRVQFQVSPAGRLNAALAAHFLPFPGFFLPPRVIKSTSSTSNNGGVKINVTQETIDGVVWEVVKEGEGSIRKMKDLSKEAFYNPIQEFNRDISIALVNLFSRRVSEGKDSPAEDKEGTRGLVKAACEERKKRGGITVFEGLAATGLRSMRYAKEIKGLARIYANDIDPCAVESIRRNAEFNKLVEGVL